jgi:hypothetical protein
MAFTKNDMVHAIYTRLDLPKHKSEEVVESLLEIMKRTLLKLGKKCCSGTGDICIFARIKIPSPISVFLEKPRCHSAITTKNTPQQTRRGQTMTA